MKMIKGKTYRVFYKLQVYTKRATKEVIVRTCVIEGKYDHNTKLYTVLGEDYNTSDRCLTNSIIKIEEI